MVLYFQRNDFKRFNINHLKLDILIFKIINYSLFIKVGPYIFSILNKKKHILYYLKDSFNIRRAQNRTRFKGVIPFHPPKKNKQGLILDSLL
jgi:hypothetical protein